MQFSTIKGVSEDVPDIVLNLKAVAVKTEKTDAVHADLWLIFTKSVKKD